MRTISTIQLVLFSVMPAQITGQTLSFFHSFPGLGQPAAVATNSSGIYVAGGFGVAAGATGVYVIGGVVKYDSGGNQLWTQGMPASGTGPPLVLRNYSDGGVELWTKQLQQEFTTAALAADASGVYAAVRDGFGHSLTKYSSDGSQLWNRQWDAPSQGVSLAVVTDTTGVYVLSFGTVGSGAGVLARKFDSGGNELWDREYATGFPTAFSAASPSGFFVAGGPGFGFVNTTLSRYDAGGNELWNVQIATPPINGLAADATGVYTVGATGQGPALPGQCRYGSGGDSFVVKYDLNGAEVWTREFGGSGAASPSGLAVNSDGVYVVGRGGSGLGPLELDGFPDPGSGFLAKLQAAPATGPGPRIVPDCIVNAASYVGGGVAPGEIVTLFGSGIGPPNLVPLSLTDGGSLATILADTRIWFDDVAAPLLYVSDGQSSAIVPYELAGLASVDVEVEYKGVRSDPVTVPVLASRPGIFTVDASGQGQGAILNEDGTLNSPSNPAQRGSVISIFGTGGGEAAPGLADGQIIGGTLPMTSLPVSVFFDIGLGDDGPPALQAEVQYAGGSVGSVAGLLQVNVRVPADAKVTGDIVPFVLIIGSQWTAYQATVALK